MRKSEHPSPAHGVYAALATPRAQNAVEADAAAIFDYIDTIVCAGVDGLVLFGSTGEFIHFDIGERMRVLMLAIKRSRVPLLVNVSHSTLAGALELAEHAIEAQAAGVLLMPPYYYRYNEAQISEFYRHFVASVDDRLPIYLYNIPAFTNPISPAAADRLLSSGSFAGIKDSSGDEDMFEVLQSLRAKLPFQWLVGKDSRYFGARQCGADGIVSGIAAALPELVVALEAALAVNDLERAGVFDRRLKEFIAWVDNFPATFAIKRAGLARGWKLGDLAVPCDEQTSALLGEFEKWLIAWLPGVLAESKVGAVRT